MKIFIFTALFFSFSLNAQAQNFDYKSFESCLRTLGWRYAPGKSARNIDGKIPDTRILGNLTNNTKNSYRINAVLIPEKKSDGSVELHVLQDPNTPNKRDENGDNIYCRNPGIQQSFSIPRSKVGSSPCSNEGSHNLAIQTGGHCHGPGFGYFDWSLPEVKLSVSQAQGREETRICHNIYDRSSRTETLRGSQISSDKITELAQKAMLEEIQFMDKNLKAGNITIQDFQTSQIARALQEGGSCWKATSPSIEFIASTSSLLCTVDPKQQNGCIKGDINNGFPGPGNTNQ